MIGRKGGEGREEEKWWKGQGEEGRQGIDHATAPAITSDMLLCFYCTVMPNKILSYKNSREKQHVLNERVRGGDESLGFASLIKINLYPFHQHFGLNKGHVTEYVVVH